MRPKCHTGELEPEAVLANSLNSFSLDYSIHFFSSLLFLHFIILYFHLFSELKMEKIKIKIQVSIGQDLFFHQFSGFQVLCLYRE